MLLRFQARLRKDKSKPLVTDLMLGLIKAKYKTSIKNFDLFHVLSMVLFKSYKSSQQLAYLSLYDAMNLT